MLRTVDHGELPNNVDLVVQLVRFIAGQPKPAADSGGGAVLVFLPGMSSANDFSQEFFGVCRQRTVFLKNSLGYFSE